MSTLLEEILRPRVAHWLSHIKIEENLFVAHVMSHWLRYDVHHFVMRVGVMQKIAGKILLSASDLANFAECSHRTWLDRKHLDHPMTKAIDDAQMKLVQERGFAHEADHFAQLKAKAGSVCEVDVTLPIVQRAEATRRAILDGTDVIYQGTLCRDDLLGHADFLLKTDTTTAAGWGYEVVDTKLARSTKTKFLLQLCFYSDLLADITGELPQHMHVVLGHGVRESFKVSDYIYFYRTLLEQLRTFLAAYPDETAVPYPSPCGHCNLCPWRDQCAARRVADDHLSAVAGITRQQIIKLEAAQVTTVAELATLPSTARIPKIAPETLQKLHHQARLQVQERTTGQAVVEVLPHDSLGSKGFARLPQPSHGDVFFDMEGNPMAEGGLEYLFGVYYFDDGLPVFKAFWAHNREEERQAFIDFITFIMSRRSSHPDMHVYHYAHYENTALKRLMTTHGVCEAAVDQLLREGRLVDLYKVVREGIRVSKDSYSIKAIESFYAEKRDAEVKKATDSIVVYEQWCQARSPELLESIRQYNEDDCRSTAQLRDWLLSLRPAGLPWYTAAGTDSVKAQRDKSSKTATHEAMLVKLHDQLLVRPQSGVHPELAVIVDSLLDFYRRAAKPQWWALFERQTMSYDELLEDIEVIAGLYAPEYVEEGERFGIYRYHFPEQDFKVREGEPAARLDTLKEVRIWGIDEEQRWIEIEFNVGKDGPPPALSISVGVPLESSAMQSALIEFASHVAVGGSQYKAVQEYLLRQYPDIRGMAPGAPITTEAAAPLTAAMHAVEQLNASYLFIQGPPGTGKTYTGSYLIAALLRAGKRVAVSSNSHKAINNLLAAVDRRMEATGDQYVGMKKISKPEQGVESRFITNVGENGAILEADPPAQLVAATAWTLARQEFRQSFDYLFIDEAGQVSLANTIAMGMCAQNLILLGDQMQLGQPIQGTHPGRSGESALEYLLDVESTIPATKGVFLGVSYRMHPDVCRFISDAIYDGRLHSAPSTHAQRLVLSDSTHPMLKPTGIRYAPVSHDGCSQRSEEEATVVREIVESLLSQRYQDAAGQEHRMTLDNILVVAPYNLQVNLLKRVLPHGARVGTVDKFQGQEAEVVIVSMATSSAEHLPQNVEFLFSKNRINVAISRAKCLSLVLFSPRLLRLRCNTPEDMALVNTFAYLSGED